MDRLKERIISEGIVYPGNILNVGSFLNQCIDTTLTYEMALEIKRLYSNDLITVVLTMESSGITLAFATANTLRVPMVFAKKHISSNLGSTLISTKIHSFTYGNDYIATVDNRYIAPYDKVLVVDDFLANGEALAGMIDLVKQSGASLVGAAIAIEKGFQGAGDRLRAEGIRVESLAIIEAMSPEEGVVFR